MERYNVHLMSGRILHINATSPRDAEREANVWHQFTDAATFVEHVGPVRGKVTRVVKVIPFIQKRPW